MASPKDGKEDAFTDSEPFLNEAAQRSSVAKWQRACLGEAFEVMKQEAPSAISEAMGNRWFEIVEQIYQWLTQYAPEIIEKNSGLEVIYFRSLKLSGRAPDALRFGGELFKRRVANIGNIQERLELLNRQKNEDTARILEDEDFDFDQKVDQLARIDLLDSDETIAIQEQQDEEALRTLVQRKIKSWLIRQWIFFFRQLNEVMDLNLKASYDLQGVESLPYLLSWKDQFSEAYRWFRKITMPLREGQELAWLAELTILDLELQMWECRLDSRKLFFAPDAQARREEARGLSGRCSLRRDHLAKVREVSPQLATEDRVVAEKIKNDPRVLITLIGYDRILAAMDARSYEYREYDDRNFDIGFDMDDEALALLGVHEHPVIQARISSGVQRFQEVLKGIEDFSKDPRLDALTRAYLGEQYSGTMSQLSEHVPKLGNYVEGFEWYQQALQMADSLQNNHIKSLAMNAFAFENLLGISKRLIAGHGGEELLEEARMLCRKFDASFPVASSDPCLYASFLLQIGLAIEEEAKTLDEDPGQRRYIDETTSEILLSLLEIPTLPEDQRGNWLNQAWDIVFGITQDRERPNQEGLHGWAHYKMDALARCLSHTRKHGGDIDIEFQLPIHIPLEAYEAGLRILVEDAGKSRPTDFPPSYLQGLRKKAQRLECLVNIIREERDKPPPEGEGDEGPELKIVV